MHYALPYISTIQSIDISQIYTSVVQNSYNVLALYRLSGTNLRSNSVSLR